MSLGGNGSVECFNKSLPPAAHTPVAILRQGSPREIRISESRSGIFGRTPAGEGRYIRSRIAFRVALERIAVTHFSASGK